MIIGLEQALYSLQILASAGSVGAQITKHLFVIAVLALLWGGAVEGAIGRTVAYSM